MPIPMTVSGGSLFIYSPGGISLTLLAPAFSALIKVTDIGSFAMPNFLGVGTVYTPHGTLSGNQTLNTGIVDYNVHLYPQLWLSGALTFKGSPFTVPAAVPDKPIAETNAFTM